MAYALLSLPLYRNGGKIVVGNNRANRFKNNNECTDYLKKNGISTITCLIYGGTFKSKSLFKCDIDGYEWESSLDAVRYARATGCPKCGHVARVTNITDVNRWLDDNNRNIQCIYYDGKVNSSKSKFTCLIDKYEWTSRFNNIKSGKGCPVCSKVKKITDISEVNQWLSENNRDMKCIDYCGNLSNLSKFKCKICSKTWKSTFNNIKNGNSCPHCSASKGERHIAKILNEHNIQYKSQYWFNNCRIQLPLPFDFALFKNNKLVGLCEYQGEQHYKPVDFANKGIDWAENQFKRNQFSDGIKRTYCKRNNIPLLEIPYWEYDNAENIILKFLKEVA